ncbi:AI-2E family transporter, partial [Streptomyces sp. NPDC001919]
MGERLDERRAEAERDDPMDPSYEEPQRRRTADAPPAGGQAPARLGGDPHAPRDRGDGVGPG